MPTPEGAPKPDYSHKPKLTKRGRVDKRKAATAKHRAGETRAAQAEVRDKHTMELMDMVSTGQWISHKSPAELAEQWGVTKAYVGELRVEASRTLRLMHLRDKDAQGDVLAQVEFMVGAAMSQGKIDIALKAILALQGLRERYGLEDAAAKAGKDEDADELTLAALRPAQAAAEQNARGVAAAAEPEADDAPVAEVRPTIPGVPPAT